MLPEEAAASTARLPQLSSPSAALRYCYCRASLPPVFAATCNPQLLLLYLYCFSTSTPEAAAFPFTSHHTPSCRCDTAPRSVALSVCRTSGSWLVSGVIDRLTVSPGEKIVVPQFKHTCIEIFIRLLTSIRRSLSFLELPPYLEQRRPSTIPF